MPNKDYLLKKLKTARGHLTRQQLLTLRGQILSGDIVGAEKGLNKLLERKGQNYDT